MNPLPQDAQLLRVYLKESDRFEGRPLYEVITLKAKEVHLMGATVLRGPMGYGHSAHLHTAKILRLSMDLPLVIEIVETEERLLEFVATIRPMLQGGIVTLEKVRVLHHPSHAPTADEGAD